MEGILFSLEIVIFVWFLFFLLLPASFDEKIIKNVAFYVVVVTTTKIRASLFLVKSNVIKE